MRTRQIWLIVTTVFLSIFYIYCTLAEEETKKIGDVNVPASMEVIKEADVNVLVPKGGQLQKESSFLVGENPDAYASRKFIEMEGYLKDIRNELERQKTEMDELKSIIEKMRQEKTVIQPPGTPAATKD